MPRSHAHGSEQGDSNLSEARKRFGERILSGPSAELVERDAKAFLHQALSTPVMNGLASAKGASITDTGERTYLDMHGNGVHNAGFNHPRVLDAVRACLDADLTFCPRRYTNEPAVALAEKLAQITPGDLTRSLFCPGGSEAIEMALALARLVTGNFKTISFRGSFHGAGLRSHVRGRGGALHRRVRPPAARRAEGGLPRLLPQPVGP